MEASAKAILKFFDPKDCTDDSNPEDFHQCGRHSVSDTQPVLKLMTTVACNAAHITSSDTQDMVAAANKATGYTSDNQYVTDVLKYGTDPDVAYMVEAHSGKLIRDSKPKLKLGDCLGLANDKDLMASILKATQDGSISTTRNLTDVADVQKEWQASCMVSAASQSICDLGTAKLIGDDIADSSSTPAPTKSGSGPSPGPSPGPV